MAEILHAATDLKGPREEILSGDWLEILIFVIAAVIGPPCGLRGAVAQEADVGRRRALTLIINRRLGAAGVVAVDAARKR